MSRIFIIVLDSLGVGELPDAADYGDSSSNTLASLIAGGGLHIPNLTRLGLLNIEGLTGGVSNPTASYARMAEASVGKDTIIGHWEIAGYVSEKPMPTYPDGFPPELLKALAEKVERGTLCGKPYSGTQVISDFGRQHVETGDIIVYTSADSVMQIATHEDIVPLTELYRICRSAREFMQGDNAVGRIIARPFAGGHPDFTRTTGRHDYSLAPPTDTMLDVLKKRGLDVISVGKIFDIFAGRGITESILTCGNTDGMNKTIELLRRDFSGLCFVNLVDFDMLYGHRNDVAGYANALNEFDRTLDALLPMLGDDDALIITADHGCDPSTPSTDHSREYTPMLFYGKKIKPGVNLGTRSCMSDIAATVQEYFGINVETQGHSFWNNVKL